ncbi:MAG: hypothetical protein OEY38_07660 [Gammaproteobacteria bacterium]|nr:hypothetical protein [Gammaproteobacteria bacterium]
MNKSSHIRAIKETNHLRLIYRKVGKILAIFFILFNFALYVFLKPQIPPFLLQISVVFSMVSIIALVFLDRCALLLCRFQFRGKMPYKELLAWSEPKDAFLEAEVVLEQIYQRQLKASKF